MLHFAKNRLISEQQLIFNLKLVIENHANVGLEKNRIQFLDF